LRITSFSGVTTVEEGIVEGQSLTLTTRDVARMSFSNDVAVTKVSVVYFIKQSKKLKLKKENLKNVYQFKI